MALLSQRLKNEISKIVSDKDINSPMFVLQMTNSMYVYKGQIHGPKDSLYSGYSFDVELSLPLNYPFSPPNVKFITPIKHININANGDICLNILKNGWDPKNTMASVMISIHCLLAQPNFEDAFNDDLLEIYKNSKVNYSNTIIQFCKDNAINK